MHRKGTYMSTILKGAPVVAAMNEANAARCAALREKGVVPTLAVVRVGERPDDLSYEKGVMARCAKVGVEGKQFLLPADASQEELLRVIAGINADAAIHGCLLFRPLPRQFDDRTIRAALAPEKDMDGFNLRFCNYDDSWLTWTIKTLDVEEENGDKLNDAVYARNRRVEAKYNCQITEELVANPGS